MVIEYMQWEGISLHTYAVGFRHLYFTQNAWYENIIRYTIMFSRLYITYWYHYIAIPVLALEPTIVPISLAAVLIFPVVLTTLKNWKNNIQYTFVKQTRNGRWTSYCYLFACID